jgi:large subunit ribosomal protein L25
LRAARTTYSPRLIAMSTVLVAETGRPTGSANSRRMRREEHIPAVVYGQGMQPITISVVRRDLRHALSGPAGVNTVLDLTVDGKVFPAIVKELQRHPVRRTVAHVDFLQVNLNEEITIAIPVRLEGEAKQVIAEGGLVDPAVDTIEVRTTPRNIPNEIVIDITDMTMDTVITLGDIQLPAGVTPVAEPDMAVVTVLITRAEELEEPAEGEEGEAGEAGEGEATQGETESAAGE